MQELLDVLNVLNQHLGASTWFPYVLVGTGLFFTFYLRFPQVRYFRHALDVVRGKFERADHKGDTSHFQALTTALSGTVGVGNIGGVALAIHLGGPAALFWMWVTAFFGMTTKFVEVTLSHKYRETSADGTIAGGPMYFMKQRLNWTKKDGSVIPTGKWLGAFFAVATVISSIGSGNFTQTNNVAVALQTTFGVERWIAGLVLAFFLAVIIIGGIRRIAQVTERVVPTMAAIYVLGAFAVIFANLEHVGSAFLSILSGAFTGAAATGGFLGATFAFAFNRGVDRGLFSNEAGQGSAPIAHAAARADEPVSEGIVAILEPFIDTLVICTITGLVILSSGVWTEKFDNTFQRTDLLILEGDYREDDTSTRSVVTRALRGQEGGVPAYNGTLQIREGMAQGGGFTIMHARSFAEDVRFIAPDNTPFSGALDVRNGLPTRTDVTLQGRSLVHSVVLTTEAFKRGFLGGWGQYIIGIGLTLFAFSTVVSWSYYGDRAITYLVGSGGVLYYRICYVAGAFLATLVDTSIIWTLASVTIAIMALPNLLGILVRHREMKTTVAAYVETFNAEHPEERSVR